MPKHGHITTVNGRRVASPTYRSWQAMKNRCTNPRSQDFPVYSTLGMDPRWTTFEPFLADMGERPSLAHTLDRVDTRMGYSRSNCRWATVTEQNRNRSTVKLNPHMAVMIRIRYEYGETQKELAEEYGTVQSHISRIVRGGAWFDDDVPF